MSNAYLCFDDGRDFGTVLYTALLTLGLDTKKLQQVEHVQINSVS